MTSGRRPTLTLDRPDLLTLGRSELWPLTGQTFDPLPVRPFDPWPVRPLTLDRPDLLTLGRSDLWPLIGQTFGPGGSWPAAPLDAIQQLYKVGGGGTRGWLLDRNWPLQNADSPIAKIEIGRWVKQRRQAYVIEMELTLYVYSDIEVVCCVQVL